MPLYEYQCEACERRTEMLQRMSDPPLTACPHCGGTLRKLFSAPSFQLKGSGWYASDYQKKSGGASRESGKSGEEGGAGDSSSSPSSDATAKAASSAAPAASSESPAKSGDAGSAKPAASKAAE
jgi:putative FmdB family regulatory protein